MKRTIGRTQMILTKLSSVISISRFCNSNRQRSVAEQCRDSVDSELSVWVLSAGIPFRPVGLILRRPPSIIMRLGLHNLATTRRSTALMS